MEDITNNEELDQIKEDNVKQLIPVMDTDTDKAIDKSLSKLPLEITERELLAKIIDAPTRSDLQEQLELFNINQSKKSALRIIKLNNLLDMVEDQAISRFEKRPDQVSNKELLEYMSVVSGQIDRAQQNINLINEKPKIQVTNQTNEVNINMTSELDKDSKERVMDAISALLKNVKAKVDEDNKTEQDENIIEADFTDTSDTTLYNTGDNILNSEDND